MAVKIFFHSQDLDGKCSAAIALKALPAAELFPINYGEAFPWDRIDLIDEVIMVDFSLPMSDMDRLNTLAHSFIWIDHHVSAIRDEEAHGYPRINGTRLSDHTAACQLCWTWFFPTEQMPAAVELLGKYDVFDLSPAVLNFQFGMRSRPNNPTAPVWQFLLATDEQLGKVEKDLISEISRQGRAVLAYRDQEYAYLVKQAAFRTVIAGHVALAVNQLYANSQVFDSVLGEHPEAEVLIAFGRETDKWRCTLWQGPAGVELDVSEIAKRFGGGGHKGAAGIQGGELPFAF